MRADGEGDLSIGGVESFVGSWRLVSFEHVLPSGEVSKPFGISPLGSLVYQADGHMSGQLCVGSAGGFASNDPIRASAEGATDDWPTYFGYWGSFEIRAAEHVVVHRVEGSSSSDWIGTEQVRPFRFDGPDRLVLEAESSSGHSTLVWQRREARRNNSTIASRSN